MLSKASVAQAMVKSTWNFTLRSLGDGNTSPVHGVTNMSHSTSEWSGVHANYQTLNYTNPTIHTFGWSYGSGNYNRPTSRKCKFYIKF